MRLNRQPSACQHVRHEQVGHQDSEGKMNTAIETDHLVKRFGDVTAVDGLSLRVARGEIYAFLGLNGAGKTTTIRLLLGMVRPTAGEAYVLGARIRVGDKKPWDSVGYMVETPDAYPQLSVRELLHKPALLLLDEPALGLDPAGIVEIRNLLVDLAQNQGITVFMSSHILGEVSRLAKRIGIIHRGRLLQELDVDELERNRRRRLVIRARDGQAACSVLLTAGFSADIASDGTIEVSDDAAIERPDEIATRLVNAGHAPTMLTVEEEDLEHYFLRLVGMDGGNAE
jgi:ABC-2 type transport system ATP-binding protein